jgi:hypothetical protein
MLSRTLESTIGTSRSFAALGIFGVTGAPKRPGTATARIDVESSCRFWPKTQATS